MTTRIPPMFQLSNEHRIIRDERRMGDFLGEQEIEFAGRFSRQRFEAFSADFPNFLGSLPECHTQPDDERDETDEQHGEDHLGFEPPSGGRRGYGIFGHDGVVLPPVPGSSRKVSVKVEPRPMWLSTPMEPFMRWTTFLMLYKPNPVPLPGGFVVKKGSKIRLCTSVVMPQPVSETRTCVVPATAEVSSVKVPRCSMAWTAFVMRLTNTWRSSSGFPFTTTSG